MYWGNCFLFSFDKEKSEKKSQLPRFKVQNDNMSFDEKILFSFCNKKLKAQKREKWRQGNQTHLYIYGDHTFIGDRAQGYSQW